LALEDEIKLQSSESQWLPQSPLKSNSTATSFDPEYSFEPAQTEDTCTGYFDLDLLLESVVCKKLLPGDWIDRSKGLCESPIDAVTPDHRQEESTGMSPAILRALKQLQETRNIYLSIIEIAIGQQGLYSKSIVLPDSSSSGNHKKRKQIGKSNPSIPEALLLAKKRALNTSTSHHQIERKYRNNLNSKLSVLRNCIPNLHLGSPNCDLEDSGSEKPGRRIGKAMILTEAVIYIRVLEKRGQQLSQTRRALMVRTIALEEIASAGSF
jgi:Helix-loop-helix DNA-binding domain